MRRVPWLMVLVFAVVVVSPAQKPIDEEELKRRVEERVEQLYTNDPEKARALLEALPASEEIVVIDAGSLNSRCSIGLLKGAAKADGKTIVVRPPENPVRVPQARMPAPPCGDLDGADL